MKICEYMKEAWFASLTREVQASNKTRVAEKMGVSRSTLSAVFNGIGEYGKGTAGTEKFARLFLGAFGGLPCPYLGEGVSAQYCEEISQGKPPTHNPAAMRHWQACQQCEYMPKQSTEKQSKSSKRMKTVQATVDTVTLALPEVGAPQPTPAPVLCPDNDDVDPRDGTALQMQLDGLPPVDLTCIAATENDEPTNQEKRL
ncbi:hypothetical protein FHW83_004707 [Duganella sp. SG902]|uniref:helix-turn-helix transcriptional regulator n=1 Tax=Duganella sp. SG902 TaxID=2587016 RepID=UPI00159E23DF|nr:helix-turn-helix transcriptional regulator [Duganella sp. SG902]NVM78876.1 hypothetical protein [Duganella sp. SG902]